MGFVRLVGVFGVVLLCCACGADDGGGDEEDRPSGTVTEEWSEFCIATFTKDYEIIDSFDEPQFRAKKGEQYLLSELGDSFGPSAELVYLWPGGPEEFTIEVNTTAELPFTTSCPLNTAQPYYAVFEDVTVYADEALSTKLCDLEAGSALPRTDAVAGYSMTSFEFFGPNVYEVYLNAFSAQCGADTGYVNVQPVESFDSTTWLVPIIGVLHP